MKKGRMTKKALAALYDVRPAIMSKWLGLIGMGKPIAGGYYYTPGEVLVIYGKLGSPYDDE